MIMAFQAILRSTPAFYLFDELMSSLVEFQHWLKGLLGDLLSVAMHLTNSVVIEIALNDVDRKCIESASQTLGLLFKLKSQNEEDGQLNAIESKQISSSHSDQLVQSTASLDLNSTIRIIKQTNLK